MKNIKRLYFLQRGSRGGEQLITYFGIAGHSDTTETSTIQAFAESKGFNLLDSEVNNVAIVDWTANEVVIRSDKSVDSTDFLDDLKAAYPHTFTGFTLNIGDQGNVVCKYD